MIKVIERDGIRYEYCENNRGEIYGVLAGSINSQTFGPLTGDPLRRFKERMISNRLEENKR